MVGIRGKREGTIRKRPDGRYEGRVLLGYRDGKKIRPSFYGDTRAEVQRQIREAVGAVERGTFVAHTEQTVGEFLTAWLEDVAKPTIRPKTYRSYEQLVRLHLKPGLGAYRLQKLTPQQVQTFLAERHQNGLSPRSVQYLKAVLRRALSHAVKWGLVVRNVASLADAPPVEAKEVRPLTVPQAKVLLEKLKGHRLEALFNVALALGLRQGEVLGLRWKDVDLKNGSVKVVVALQYLDGEFKLVEPKTKRSRRQLPLTPAVLKLLRQHRAKQGQERLAAGSEWEDWGLVFTTRKGRPLEGARINRDFKKILKAAKLPAQRFHDLRHACATFLLAQGLSPRVVMEWLDHSQIGLTMNTYAHVMPAAKQDAADRMQSLLA